MHDNEKRVIYAMMPIKTTFVYMPLVRHLRNTCTSSNTHRRCQHEPKKQNKARTR